MIDLDNTLIDRDAGFRTGLLALLDDRGLPAEHADWIMEIDQRGYTPRPVVAKAMLDRLDLGLTEDDLITALIACSRDNARLAPETAAAIERARAAGHRVVIVTNGPVPSQTGKIRNAGLDRLVDASIVSGAIGTDKPEPAVFHAAAAAVGGSLADAWMIGDRDDADILGAHRLGVPSVWLHLGRTWTAPDYRPTHTADTVVEAIDHAANA
ncbi:HAD family hydrolase [Glycomyces terrestris]|uniref:HAD family hydrolase n=2 Tax=Glycomyces terrestris TaxID=2493553 RepID=A0A426UWQ8_9ACTN|nr:HAD family hydrolase [Glycomyces terrestris]